MYFSHTYVNLPNLRCVYLGCMLKHLQVTHINQFRLFRNPLLNISLFPGMRIYWSGHSLETEYPDPLERLVRPRRASRSSLFLCLFCARNNNICDPVTACYPVRNTAPVESMWRLPPRRGVTMWRNMLLRLLVDWGSQLVDGFSDAS